jgi:hypothetical protein
MLKRHQESHDSHIDRIRRNLPSAQQPRSKLDNLMIAAASEEAMRLKNLNAIQRAIQNDNQNGAQQYKPSVNVLKHQYHHVRNSVDQKANENLPPTSHRSAQRPSSRIVSKLEAEMMERKHNIVSESALRDLRRII